MQIDLNDPHDFTSVNVARLIGSKDDSQHRQLRVTQQGIAYLSDKIGAEDIVELAFRLETWLAGNGYVGVNAAKDSRWVSRVYMCLKNNWPNPTSSYIDSY